MIKFVTEPVVALEFVSGVEYELCLITVEHVYFPHMYILVKTHHDVSNTFIIQ